MIRIDDLRTTEQRIIVQGMHQGIIQAMLDYDILLGRDEPSIIAVVAKGRRRERFFWGKDEIALQIYTNLIDIEPEKIGQTTAVLNVQSARNVQASVLEVLKIIPSVKVISIFAENTPEAHTTHLIAEASKTEVLIVGPSSVGLLIPGNLKLGAIGGTTYEQLHEARIKEAGDIAIVTTSGGMVNEIIRMVASVGRKVSFAVALGGDRYPILDPPTAILLAEADPLTTEIIYFGELGGVDEYDIAKLVKSGKVKKPIHAYIAGVVADVFATPPQFGHAKALAESRNESAKDKKAALRAVGIDVSDGFADIMRALRTDTFADLPKVPNDIKMRRRAYFMSHISGEKEGDVELLGKSLIETVNDNTFGSLVLSLLMGKQITSKKLIDFTDLVLRLLVDHSPNVSGAVNTIITARAGKDLVSSLTAGLLTIGPRFGGAVNAAAATWLEGVHTDLSPQEFVEKVSRTEGAISGIGHKKYRVDNPDPRVEALLKFSKGNTRYVDFARSIESITIAKKSNLILNVDGAIAAIMLDLLTQELKMTKKELQELIDIEFFNALFVLSRSVGFTAHYLDQRRYDEGLFRLDDEDIRYF